MQISVLHAWPGQNTAKATELVQSGPDGPATPAIIGETRTNGPTRRSPAPRRVACGCECSTRGDSLPATSALCRPALTSARRASGSSGESAVHARPAHLNGDAKAGSCSPNKSRAHPLTLMPPHHRLRNGSIKPCWTQSRSLASVAARVLTVIACLCRRWTGRCCMQSAAALSPLSHCLFWSCAMSESIDAQDPGGK